MLDWTISYAAHEQNKTMRNKQTRKNDVVSELKHWHGNSVSRLQCAPSYDTYYNVWTKSDYLQAKHQNKVNLRLQANEKNQ